jgi:hypothetical protein
MRSFLTKYGELIVAVCALILSQLPPLTTFFSKPDTSIKILSEIDIEHRFGYFFLFPYVQFHNSGNSRDIFTKITFNLSKAEDNFTRKMEAQQILEQNIPGDQSVSFSKTIPFSSIPIKANEIWNGRLEISKQLSQNEQEEFDKFVGAIIEQIEFQELPKIKTELFQNISRVSEERLRDFTKGTYYLKASFKSEKTGITNKCYSFIIHENDLKRLEQITKQYEYGRPIARKPIKNPYITVHLKSEDINKCK